MDTQGPKHVDSLTVSVSRETPTLPLLYTRRVRVRSGKDGDEKTRRQPGDHQGRIRGSSLPLFPVQCLKVRFLHSSRGLRTCPNVSFFLLTDTSSLRPDVPGIRDPPTYSPQETVPDPLSQGPSEPSRLYIPGCPLSTSVPRIRVPSRRPQDPGISNPESECVWYPTLRTRVPVITPCVSVFG